PGAFPANAQTTAGRLRRTLGLGREIRDRSANAIDLLAIDQLTCLLDNLAITSVSGGFHEPTTFTGSEAVPLDSLWDCACPNRWVRLGARGIGDVLCWDCECARVQSR